MNAHLILFVPPDRGTLKEVEFDRKQIDSFLVCREIRKFCIIVTFRASLVSHTRKHK